MQNYLTSFEKSLDWLQNNGIEFPQNKIELNWMIRELDYYKCSSILEIGSREGGAFFCLGATLEKVITMVSVDLENGPWGYDGSSKKLGKVCGVLKNMQKNINLIKGNSRAEETILRVNKIKPIEGFSFIFIDGDHSYEGVRDDWKNYRSMLKRNGLIAFHDISPKNPNKKVQVPAFWEYLKSNFITKELIQEWGIGILYT